MGKLDTKLAGIKLKNPVMLASGTFGPDYADYINLNLLGAVITKTVTLKPKAGNPPPRICETPAGMLNTIGLQNIGIDNFINNDIDKLLKLKTNLIINIGGDNSNEYLEVAKILNSHKISAIELNISCPNVYKGGMSIGVNAQATHQLVSSIKNVSSHPVIVKLSPNVTDIVAIAKAAEDAGADAISLINTLLGMAIDINTKKPKLSRVVGGLSGPAIKPVALRMVWQVSQAVKIPIIGIGGIMNASDAIEFFLAGAQAVQIGTANFIDIKSSLTIIKGIKEYLAKNKLKSIKDLIGKVKLD